MRRCAETTATIQVSEQDETPLSPEGSIPGGFVRSLDFLLWLEIVLLVIAVIAFLMRSIGSCR